MNIPLTKGLEAIIDDDDAYLQEDPCSLYLSHHKWGAIKGTYNHTHYAFRTVTRNGKRRIVFMHRLIMGARKGESVGHINHNGLDNRRENLRIATHKQNIHNSHPRGGRKYKGIAFYIPALQWVAHYGKKHIGYFDSEHDAAQAYNAVAFAADPIHAYLNDIPGRGKCTDMPDTHSPTERRNTYRGARKRSKHCWEAYISFKGRRWTIGNFKTEIEAAKAFNDECVRLGCLERINDLRGPL